LVSELATAWATSETNWRFSSVKMDGFLVTAGDQQVGERVADGIGDVLEREVGVLIAAGDDDVGDGNPRSLGRTSRQVRGRRE
jgi:hypothetical protein